MLDAQHRHPKGLGRSTAGTWTRLLIAIAAPIIVSAGLAILSLGLLIGGADTQQAQIRIDIVKTGLAIGAGVGGVIALMVAGRRQWFMEKNAAIVEYDATQRRITESYTKAVEQLGSEKSAVRLGGLYALERLGRDAADQQEAILSLICAYLRMPDRAHSGRALDTITIDGDPDVYERQVRLAAQRILYRHRLRDNAADWWDVPPLDLAGAHLAGAFFMNVDLSGADLTDANLEDAILGGANLSGVNAARANLRRANLVDTNLSNASLEDADASGAAMPGINLTNARISTFVGLSEGSHWRK